MKEKTWTQLWLNYSRKKDCGNGRFLESVRLNGFDEEREIVKNSLAELRAGGKAMLGVAPGQGTVQGQTADERRSESGLLIKRNPALKKEGWRLNQKGDGLTLEAADENGLLYGIFGLLRLIAMEKPLAGLEKSEAPDNPFRMYNHWDNMDGSIERGYSGESFFFENNEVIVNERTRDYARFAASIGINGVVINNVNVKNAATWLITDRYLGKVRELSELFAGYGIKLYLSLNFAAPMELGGPDSADPLDEGVRGWWKEKLAEVFREVPLLGGFLVKADSEGRPGPFTYGRTQADGANMLADLVKPYGGIIIWRCFVYNCTQDWRDYKTDRARAGYDNFIVMDGDYHDNVILQIKNGPMDFQIREPVSPLLGGLRKTNQMLEVQVAQEYTGHQIDVCYLIPLFKEVLDFHTYCKEGADTVADIISGRTLKNTNTGIAAVCNTGNDANWTGSELAAANFYGFGRLAFVTSLSAEEIAEEWIRLSLSNEEDVVEAVKGILLTSRSTYEKYTCPLGIGWMVMPNTHYGCSVDGYEYSRWGTYHRADHLGIGVDRSHAGTGYAGQYLEPNASMYDAVETCPEELLLFFHHVPYTYRLKSGKTLIQHIYDTHFEGVEEVEEMMSLWLGLKDKIAREAWENVRERFERQLYNAKEWRDQVNSYFYRKSGIADEKGRTIY
ncbi:MAG: alpha-glucuronidase [Acetatifactor sp.]